MSTAVTHPAPHAVPGRSPPPLLESGDRLSRAEFERRYRAMPGVKKAELVEGITFMPSPVRLVHGQPHAVLIGCLVYYVARTPGIAHFGDNLTVRLDDDNEPQPDALLLLPPALGGQAKVDADGYVAGPPDLVCEVAASTVSIDLHAKLSAYLRNRVKEYVVWRTEDAAVDYFVFRDGRYDRHPPGPDGLLRSALFPGLWLDPAALIAGDLPKLFRALDQGTATPEHADFVARLRG